MTLATNETSTSVYIRAKMEEIQEISNDLLEPANSFNQQELNRIMERLDRFHREIQTQIQLVNYNDLTGIMREYESLSDMADAHIARRLETLRQTEPSPSAAATGAVPKRKVVQYEAVKKGKGSASKLVEFLNEEAAKRKKKKSKESAKVAEGFMETDEDVLDIHASDHEEPSPGIVCSVAKPAPDFVPIRFPRHDLRKAIQEKQQLRERYTAANPGQPKQQPQGSLQSSNRYFHNQNYEADQRSGGSSSRLYNNSVRSFDASSYKSEPQMKIRGPIDYVPYPPALSRIPKPLSRNDASYIGNSEVYMNTTQKKPVNGQHTCPKCHGKHRLIRCQLFLRAGLQERWYMALSLGVCLNCLMPCHTSFRCSDGGHCLDCLTRHNTLLCPVKYAKNA